MGTAETPQTPPRPQGATAPATLPRAATPPRTATAPSVADGVRSAARSVAEDALFERRPYLKMAFSNPYNLSLVAGGLGAALLTANPFLALATLGIEAIWLLHAPDNARLRHILWDPRFDKLKKALEAQDRAKRMAGLPQMARDRVDALVARQDEIRRLAAENPSFAGDLLRDELVKTDRLVDAFVEMAMTCARYESYLQAVDPAQLERDRKRYGQAVTDAGTDEAQAGVARRNLAVVTKRIEKLKEIRRYLTTARGQLDLIENSFQLIADQIVTMQSPQELSGQLDELLDGVEAVRETSRETEQLLAGLDKTM